MKNTKAKFALTAIAVCAIVGGAMAFKANRGATIFTYAGTDPTAACNVQLRGFTITPQAPGAPARVSVASTTLPCAPTLITPLD